MFTHEQRLKKGEKNLKEKLGGLLIQLPPSLSCALPVAEEFFSEIRKTYSGPIAFEPRHPSWDSGVAIELTKYLRIKIATIYINS